jgi:hypothetical protein
MQRIPFVISLSILTCALSCATTREAVPKPSVTERALAQAEFDAMANAAGLDSTAVWYFIPQNFSFGPEYILARGDTLSQARVTSLPGNMEAIGRDDTYAIGTLAELESVLIDSDSPIEALALPSGFSFDEWASVSSLQSLVEAAGWHEHPSVQGLWVRGPRHHFPH